MADWSLWRHGGPARHADLLPWTARRFADSLPLCRRPLGLLSGSAALLANQRHPQPFFSLSSPAAGPPASEFAVGKHWVHAPLRLLRLCKQRSALDRRLSRPGPRLSPAPPLPAPLHQRGAADGVMAAELEQLRVQVARLEEQLAEEQQLRRAAEAATEVVAADRSRLQVGGATAAVPCSAAQ